jgi:hypothetical protein
MFDVYKRKFPEQPFPRRHIGSFDTVEDIMEKFGFSIEEIIEGLVAVTEAGYQIEQTMRFLGEGRNTTQIAELLDIKQPVVEIYKGRAFSKLTKNGKLKGFLKLIDLLRTRQNRNDEFEYTEKIKIIV